MYDHNPSNVCVVKYFPPNITLRIIIIIIIIIQYIIEYIYMKREM